MIWAILGIALAGVPEPEQVLVRTEDGATIALHHTRRDGGPPVILCHGISSNHHFWDLDPERSLVRYLWSEGYDVWNLDLRGHGDARKGSDGKRQKAGWNIDDYGTYDLPAAISHVLSETGAEHLGYVGHSMGGMVLAVYLSTVADNPLSSAVVVGSPLDFRDPDAIVRSLLATAPAAEGLSFVPTPLGAKGFVWVRRNAPLQIDTLLYNPENIARRAEAHMLRTVVSPISKGEVAHMAHFREDGEFRSFDGSVLYREALGAVDVPIRFLTGRADRVVSPDRVRTFYDALGTADKDFIVISRANGFTGDYGHLDYGCGDHASEDVFPLIDAWFDAHP